jgi:hypothetical protein
VGRVHRAVLVVVVGAAGLTGCGDDPPCPERPDAVVAERPVELDHEGPALDAEGFGPAGFVLQVVNSQDVVERVRFAIDGRTALDVDLPADADCWGGHGPIFSVAFDLPPGPVDTELDLQGGTSARALEVPDDGTIWGVVDVQSQRGWGNLQVYADRPEWG